MTELSVRARLFFSRAGESGESRHFVICAHSDLLYFNGYEDKSHVI